MATIKYNLDDNIFLKNRLSFHAASKVGISTKESLAQATNPDGHTVTDSQVWTALNSSFPKNTGDNKTTSDGVAATKDLVAVFKNGATLKKSLAGGNVWINTNYPAVELYENVEMTAVANSDDEAWEILDGPRVMDWVAATSVKDNGVPVPGYAGIIEASSDGTSWTILQKSSALSYGWELAKGTWEFIYMPGMLKFHPDYIPSKMGFSRIRITAFKYIGGYLSDTISNMVAIKPFKFDISKMTSSNEIYKYNSVSGVFESDVEYYKYNSTSNSYEIDNSVVVGNTIVEGYFVKELVSADYSIVIDGVVFQLINNSEISIGDILYNVDGSSVIKFNGINPLYFGENTIFTAYSFVNKFGSKLTVLESSTL